MALTFTCGFVISRLSRGLRNGALSIRAFTLYSSLVFGAMGVFVTLAFKLPWLVVVITSIIGAITGGLACRSAASFLKSIRHD